MSNLSVRINGQDYPLAATLRVAFKVQGQHNHKPYAEVFKNIGDMTVEEQIGIIYAAFECGNPEVAQFWTRAKFQDYYLDNLNLKDLLDQLQTLIKNIMGDTSDEAVVAEPDMAAEASSDDLGN